jgi:hypothetical protein
MLSHGDASAQKLSHNHWTRPIKALIQSKQHTVNEEALPRPMEQPHIQARPSKRADLRDTRCRVRRTEKAGQRRTIPSSTSAQHTPNPEGSERMLCSLASRGPRKEHKCTVVRRRRRGQRLTVTVQSHCQECLDSLRRAAAIAQTAETSAGRLDQHTTPSTIGQKTGPGRTKLNAPRKSPLTPFHAPPSVTRVNRDFQSTTAVWLRFKHNTVSQRT